MVTAPDLVESLRALTREEYDRIVATGVFDEDHVELIEGVIVRMPPPQGPEHAGTIHVIQKRLTLALGDRAEVRGQSSFAASERSQPQPDIAVVPPGDYRDAHPQRAWLIVEVADSSLRHDRGAKAAVYAAAGVDEYWVVDLVHRTIEVRTEPAATGYGRLETRRRGEQITLAHFPDVTLAVDQMLR